MSQALPASALVLAAVLIAACSPTTERHGASYEPPTGTTPMIPVLVIDASSATSGPGAAAASQAVGAPLLGSVGHVSLDDGGNIYVADYQQSGVFVYNAGGRFLRSIGSSGEGPGEFQIPVNVIARGDTVYVYDNRLYRISAFRKSDGTFVRSFNVKLDEWTPRTVIGYTDSHAVAIFSPPVSFDESDVGIQNEEIRLVDLSGEDSHVIWTTPGTDWKRIEVNGMRMLRNMPLSFNSSCTMKGDVGYCGYSSAVRVNAFTLDGDSVDVAFVPAARRKVTDEERRAILDPITNPALREALVVPAEHPAFTGYIVVDDAGRVWIRRSASDEAGTEYWIIDPDNHRVLSVTLAGRATLSYAGGGRAVAAVRAADGTQSVVVYSIGEFSVDRAAESAQK